MFALRAAAASRSFSTRTFSTTMTHASDLSKLSLIGYLAKDPETRLTKNDKEFVSYTVVTKTTLPVNPNGERPAPIPTYHRILCFSESPIKFLSTLKKRDKGVCGSKLRVEGTRTRCGPYHASGPATNFPQTWTSPSSYLSQERHFAPRSRWGFLLISILLSS